MLWSGVVVQRYESKCTHGWGVAVCVMHVAHSRPWRGTTPRASRIAAQAPSSS